jgi:hypothetical protein
MKKVKTTLGAILIAVITVTSFNACKKSKEFLFNTNEPNDVVIVENEDTTFESITLSYETDYLHEDIVAYDLLNVANFFEIPIPPDYIQTSQAEELRYFTDGVSNNIMMHVYDSFEDMQIDSFASVACMLEYRITLVPTANPNVFNRVIYCGPPVRQMCAIKYSGFPVNKFEIVVCRSSG